MNVFCTVDDWLDQESRFNHDWLRNRLIVNLRAVSVSISTNEHLEQSIGRANSCLKGVAKQLVDFEQIIENFAPVFAYKRFLLDQPLCLLPERSKLILGEQLEFIWHCECVSLKQLADLKKLAVDFSVCIKSLTSGFCSECNPRAIHELESLVSEAISLAEKVSQGLTELKYHRNPYLTCKASNVATNLDN